MEIRRTSRTRLAGSSVATCLALVLATCSILRGAEPRAESESQLPTVPGERVPSEDPRINNLHSMGLVEGNTNIFRSACPVRELAKSTSKDEKTKLAEAEASMRHLHKLGICTIISFEDPYHYDADEKPNEPTPSKAQAQSVEKPSVKLERAAAEQAGIHFLSIPMRNSGENSIQDMTAGDIQKMLESNSRAILDAANKGGVLFHCSAGHDRTGIVAAYIRMKYQHWPAEEAIAEMRRYGHNWPKFSQDGGKSSWHEAKLREIAKSL